MRLAEIQNEQYVQRTTWQRPDCTPPLSHLRGRCYLDWLQRFAEAQRRHTGRMFFVASALLSDHNRPTLMVCMMEALSPVIDVATLQVALPSSEVAA